MASGPGVQKPRKETHPGRQVGPARFPTPPGGASASGLMRLSGIGAFDQGGPPPAPPRSEWGTPLDPTHGPTPGWDPGEAWPTYYNSDRDTMVPSTQNPGLYTSGTGETMQLPTQPVLAPEQFQSEGGVA